MEEIYETLQNRYVRQIVPNNSPIDTIATIKNIIIPNEIEDLKSESFEDLKEKIEDLKSESFEDLKEKIEDLKSESFEDLKEKIEDLKSEVCEICGGKYSYFNKKRHCTTKKHQLALTLSFPPSPLLAREQVVEGSSP